jgi:acyl-CoA thioester hydrolase
MPRIFVRSLTVPAEAIDAIGHVNNIEYVRWMQDVAADHSAAQGWPLERYMQSGAAWIIRSHSIEYLRPAFAGDSVSLFTWVADMSRSASRRKYLFYRARGEDILARAETHWVFVNFASGAPVRIPESLRSAFDVVPDNQALQLALAVGATP